MRLDAIPQTAVTGHAAIDDALRCRRGLGREGHPAAELAAAEDRDRRRAESDGEMRGAGLVGDDQRRVLQEIEQLVEGRRADQIGEALAAEPVLVIRLRRSADKGDGEAALGEVARDAEEILERPAAARLVGAEIDDRVRLLQGRCLLAPRQTGRLRCHHAPGERRDEGEVARYLMRRMRPGIDHPLAAREVPVEEFLCLRAEIGFRDDPHRRTRNIDQAVGD